MLKIPMYVLNNLAAEGMRTTPATISIPGVRFYYIDSTKPNSSPPIAPGIAHITYIPYQGRVLLVHSDDAAKVRQFVRKMKHHRARKNDGVIDEVTACADEFYQKAGGPISLRELYQYAQTKNPDLPRQLTSSVSGGVSAELVALGWKNRKVDASYYVDVIIYWKSL